MTNRWLASAIPPSDICDQFAFCRPGSATTAQVSVAHHVTQLSEMPYNRSSEAFDVMDHSIIVLKN